MGSQRSFNLSRRHYLRALGVMSVLGAGANSAETVAAAGGDEIWSFETGDWVFSSPAVVGGTVYVGSDDNSVYALSADDGTERWSFQTGAEVASSPAVADGIV